ncbi:amidohydrolase family protein [Pseudomonas citronellolis]|uniref:amidohydrolase family protein n=1 Tax=Pseudomonas citronellolis TaxID=53408 RepID=UPI0023E38E72|nr:amidohydrolase family protein [Pseudomonas citronellolis]MDF3936764.1 amidohydrolase family protein [Pseudomonas citronellolis]
MSTPRVGLKASFVVGFDGRQHVLWRHAEVVFEGGRILFVGRGFPGEVAQWIDYGHALIGPGFIDLDALGDLDSTVLTLDNGAEWAMGRVWSADYLRAGPQECYSPDEELFKYRYAFTQLIRNGVTTAMPITSMYYRRWAERYDEFADVAALSAELGLRSYLGPCYMSGMTYACADGSPAQHWDEPAGLAGLAAAERFFRDFDGAHGGLVRGALLPDRIETCTPALLERSAALQRELAAPLRLHCCQSRYEMDLVRRLHGQSSLQWLQRLGLLNPRSVLPHGIHVDGEEDLQRLQEGGASIVHCPVVFARDGDALDSFGAYRERGINLAMGTDTFPADMLDNLRQGLNIARVKEGTAERTRILDLYNAATLGGARALGRDDLGRLAAGARADITVFRLGALHQGPFFDPLKNLVTAGRGDDCIASYIDGRCVMQGGQVVGVDYPSLQRQADALFQKQMQHHSARAFGNPPWRELFHPSIPFADAYSAQAPLQDASG